MAANSISSFIVASLIIGLSSSGLDTVGAHPLAKPAALFVFGDSYADTGNHNASGPSLDTRAWKAPYGNTWPGKPTGRYSDGRVFTDFYASVLGVRKPVPYRVINVTRHNTVNGHSRSRPGINFAFGGSGAFTTFGAQYTTFSEQINQLQDLIREGLVSNKLIKTSTVLLVVAGNDYIAYQELQKSNATGINELISKVVREMARLLNVLHNVGFRRIVATTMEPLGCLPLLMTAGNNFTTCNIAMNQWSSLHNSLLTSHISSLQSKHPSTHFVTLDLHSAFLTIITDEQSHLRPCCVGVPGRSCGDVDENGGPLYTLCSFPNRSLFWDDVHPTNAGWKAISHIIFST